MSSDHLLEQPFNGPVKTQDQIYVNTYCFTLQAQKIISSAKIMLQEQADALTDAALQLLEEV